MTSHAGWAKRSVPTPSSIRSTTAWARFALPTLRHARGPMNKLRLGYYACALLFIFVSVFPLVYAFSSSLKRSTGLFSPELIPKQPTISNYVSVFAEQPFATNLLNSVIVAGSVVALSLALSLMAAWALGRVEFRGRGLLLVVILSA